jgi:tricorn protease-like protein
MGGLQRLRVLESFVIKLWHAQSSEITQLTQPLLEDSMPAFDPQGDTLLPLATHLQPDV